MKMFTKKSDDKLSFKEMQKLDEIYAKYCYFINYVITSDTVDLSEYTLYYEDLDFYDTLCAILECDQEQEIYSKEIHDRLGRFLGVLSKNYSADNIEIFAAIKSIYNEVKDNDSYQFYENELLFKYDKINKDLKTRAIVWNKKDIEESIEFDYNAFASLELDNFEQVLGYYTYSYKFLLFIKKLLKTYPYVVLDNKYKTRILKVLEYNKEINSNISEDIIKGYVIKNYRKEYEPEDNMKLYNDFIELNDELYTRVSCLNKKTCYSSFTLDTFENLYYRSLFEKQLLMGTNENIDYTNPKILNYLYELIEYYDNNNMCDKKMQKKLIDIMDDFKSNIKSLNRDEYYNHLMTVNGMTLRDGIYIAYLISVKTGCVNVKKMQQMNNPILREEYIETLDLDHKFLESMITTDYREYIKHFIYDDDYVGVIRRKIAECEPMFLNKKIYDKTVEAFETIIEEYIKDNLSSKSKYKENIRTLKKINKIYNGKR